MTDTTTTTSATATARVPSPIEDRFRTNIGLVRAARQMTHHQLAAKIGEDPSTLSKIEAGKGAKLTLERAAAIADALGMSIDQMLATITVNISVSSDSEVF